MPKFSERFSPAAIELAKADALQWLEGRPEGYPRTWEAEERRGGRYHDPEFDAPVIAGYEALEREGKVVRVGVVTIDGEERVHFRLAGHA